MSTLAPPPARGGVPAPGWESYAASTAGEHFAWYAEHHLVQSIDAFAGLPLVFEDWQRTFLAEALAADDEGNAYWRFVLLVVPRKNGKTLTLAAYGLYHLTQSEGSPEVLLAASSDRQAERLFGAATAFVRRSPMLLLELHLRDYIGQIARVDGGGHVERLSSDPRRLHGYSPSLCIVDELHAWTTPNLRRAWGALTTAGGARAGSQVFAITTAGEAGERETGILGTLLSAAEDAGEVEDRGALRIIRHHGARTLAYVYEAPAEADPRPLRAARASYRRAVNEQGEDSAAARDALCLAEEWRETVGQATKQANPASWISASNLADQAEAMPWPSQFLQLHAGRWAEDEGTYIAAADWRALGDPRRPILEGTPACLGIDGSRTYDTTVVGIAARAPDGRIDVSARVFSVRADVPHHVLHEGGAINLADVVEEVVDLFDRYRVRDAAYDPSYLQGSPAETISGRLPGSRIFAVEPTSRFMREALAALWRGVADGVVRHQADPVIAAHVNAARVERGEGGVIRRVVKRNPAKPIDATVAIALAYWRASRHEAVSAHVPRPRAQTPSVTGDLLERTW